MATDSRGAISFVEAVVRGITRKNVTFMAASIAYQAFISLLPLLVLVFFLVSIVGDEALAARVAETTEGFLPESGRELLEEAIAGSVATTGASAIGLVTLLWGSLKIFRGLDTAFSEIYDTTATSSILDQLRDGLVVFVALGLALLAAAVASAVFAVFPDNALVGVLNPLLLVVGLSVAFFPMYYVFPDVDVGVREVLPGVVVAAVGWAALQALFQVYVAVASSSASAGAIGAILLVLTWLYFGGLVLLVGAVVNATAGGRLSIPDADADETGDSDTFAANRLERRTETLERRLADVEHAYGLSRHELEAERRRADALESRVADLEAERTRLDRENERLRRRLERRRRPWWRAVLSHVGERTTTLSIGTVRDRRERE